MMKPLFFRARRALPALVAGLVLGTVPAARAAPFEVGEPFPPLVFPAVDGGDAISLAEFRGQKLILHVFASW